MVSSLSLSVQAGVVAGVKLIISQFISDTFPPVHLLYPLLQMGVVRIDIVMRLTVMVSSETRHPSNDLLYIKILEMQKKNN